MVCGYSFGEPLKRQETCWSSRISETIKAAANMWRTFKKKKIKWIPWKKLHTNQTKNVLILGVADLTLAPFYLGNKGNNKITELRTILQRES